MQGYPEKSLCDFSQPQQYPHAEANFSSGMKGIQFCILNDEFSIKNDGFCIYNYDFRKA